QRQKMADEIKSGLLRRISCRNPFHTIKFFVVCQGFLQLSQLLTSGYVRSAISSIEKRFGLSSQTSGMVASFNEVPNTMLIIFVSYFGSRVHRPRFIGCGAILVSLAGCILALPHFIMGPYEYDHSLSGLSSNATDMCPAKQGDAAASSSFGECAESRREDQMVLGVLLFGQTLLGLGGVPIQPFGISYIDDYASKSNSPLYVGILFATTAIGPGLAFILGSVMLRLYVDIDKVSACELPNDPRWVGAWWLGFIIAAGVVAIAAIPYFFFPEEMPREVNMSFAEIHKRDLMEELRTKPKDLENFTLMQFIKMFPAALLRNIRNPIFIMVVLALINLSSMVAGIATFLAKFLEQQFSLTASIANMIIGTVNIPGAMLGIILGGAIMKNCRLGIRKAAIMCIASMSTCLLFYVPLLFLGCSTQAVAGLDSSGSSAVGLPAAECSRHCNCSSALFNPVCGQNGVEYLSPCHAGCSARSFNYEANKAVNYTGCSCIVLNGTAGRAAPGSCSTRCSHFLMPFIMIACLAGFAGTLTHTPSFVVILRSVKPEDKSFAIGIQFLLLRLFAWLPAPMLYGKTIDTTCLLWQTKCNDRAACRYYNNTLLRQRFVGAQILFGACSFLSYCVVYYIVRRKEKQERREEAIQHSSPESVLESVVESNV
uniref:Solute carrier organic anion transporter family member n=1 Tax=Varanus komodoensis TaxID=61221 RepID=A0A8D2LP84_VARKO